MNRPEEEKIESPVFGKYLLLKRIGKGGMAEVFLARPLYQKRLVAIKVILSNLAQDKQYRDMFTREGQLALELNHDAIVKTLEVGEVKKRHFICMEYISGIDLSLLLRRCRRDPRNRLSIPHALYVAHRMCEGLHYAHEAKSRSGVPLNVVNRDVSPSNIRLSFDGHVKLLDFGIAKATSSLSSEIGVLKGKFAYMSPEQARGLPLDRRSDVFAAGIVLYEMLTQEKLFRGDSEFQAIDLARRAEIVPPSNLNRRIPQEVDAIVLTALRKDPTERYQRAEEMANALREALAKYNFQRAELQALIQTACREEWNKEQESLKRLQGVEPPKDGGKLQRFEEQGEEYTSMEINTDSESGGPRSEENRRSGPALWIWGLLALAILLLGLAVVLLVRR